jgi:hypothetical protein
MTLRCAFLIAGVAAAALAESGKASGELASPPQGWWTAARYQQARGDAEQTVPRGVGGRVSRAVRSVNRVPAALVSSVTWGSAVARDRSATCRRGRN